VGPAGVVPSREWERRQRTARRPAGTLGATAPSVGRRTATPSEPGDEPERGSGYPSMYGNSSWMLSTRASRSGRRSGP
jgi:hypothetical protein